MHPNISIKHSFNAGDLISLLPGMSNLFRTQGIKFNIFQRLNLEAYYYENATSPIVNVAGKMVCMNEEMFARLSPLIQSQEYIERFEVFNGQMYDLNLDATRDSNWIPIPNGQIHHWSWSLCPELSCDLSKQWISVSENNLYKEQYSDKIIINRTHRYNNPYINYFFLKQYKDNVAFVGVNSEYEKFCKDFELDIPLVKSDNFYQLAQIINSAKGFLGCQSFLWHVADAMKVHRILELCTEYPNTFPTGANGHGFYHQKNLELYFSKLINK